MRANAGTRVRDKTVSFLTARHVKSDKRNLSRGADLGQMQEMFALQENANRKYIR